MDFKSLEQAKNQTGGAFRLSVLLQKRIIELVRGAPSSVEAGESDRNPIDLALREILEEKIDLELIESEEFERLVEEARLEREGRLSASRDQDEPFTPPTAMPTIDLASDPLAKPEATQGSGS